MDYETFDRLHKQDPLRFSLAMEIFLDKGRIATLESGRDNLTDFVLHKLAHLLREASLRDILDTSTALAQLDTGNLLDYAKRSGYFIGETEQEPTSDGPF